MQPSIQIKVTAPCQEDWNKMSATEKGKFCMSCQKEVIDFSGMSDKEILNIITKAGSSICGRAEADQLNRTLVLPAAPHKTWWKYWIGVAASLLLLTSKSNAQKKITPSHHNAVKPKPGLKIISPPRLVGAILPVMRNPIIVKGRVVDTNGTGIPYASVMLKNAIKGIATDSSGYYTFRIDDDSPGTVLLVSSAGYESEAVEVDNMNDDQTSSAGGTQVTKNGNIILRLATMKEVIATGTAEKELTGFVGGLSVLRIEPAIIEDVKGIIKDAFRSNEIKVYPNPVKINTTFNIAFNIATPGEYNLQFVDASGKIIYGKNISINFKNYVEQFSADVFSMSGVYFVYVTSADMRKNYTAKVIVQY